MKSCSVKNKASCLKSQRCKWHDSKCKSICKNNQYYNLKKKRCKQKRNESYSKLIKCPNFKFLGNGVYGCVVKPAIENNPHIDIYINQNFSKTNNNTVGKIFKREKDFVRELKISKFVNKIDPKSTFTVKMTSASKISKDILKCNEKLRSCLKLNNNFNYYQIAYEYGGVDLTHNFDLEYKQFLNVFTKFIKGMVLLSKIGYVHWDIKSDNVLIKKNKISLIDYGLMIKASELFNGEYNLKNHDYYPDEFRIAAKYIDNNIHLRDADAFEKYTNYILERNNVSNDLKTFFVEIKNKQFYEVFTKEIALKGDVYAISFILEKLKNKITNLKYDDNRFLSYLIQRCRDKNPKTRYTMIQLFNNLVYRLKKMKSQKGGSDLFLQSTQCFKP